MVAGVAELERAQARQRAKPEAAAEVQRVEARPAEARVLARRGRSNLLEEPPQPDLGDARY